MSGSWSERVLERPYRLVRLVILLIVAAGYLILFGGDSRTPQLDWAFAIVAVVIGGFGGVSPLATALAQIGLLLVADLFGTFERGPASLVKYLAVWSLFELAVRRPWRPVAVSATALISVYTLHSAADLPAELASLGYRIVITVVFPALLGGYIRATHLLARQARERIEDQRRHHELRVRAAAVAERTAIARELHDLVAHHISSMVLRVGVAREVLPAANPRVGELSAVTELLDDLHAAGVAALADLRRLVAVLRDPARVSVPSPPPAVEPGGLTAALAAVVRHARSIGLNVDDSIDPRIGQLDDDRSQAVLRLAQEGLANVAQHAGPLAYARFSVGMTETGQVYLRIRDDGRPEDGRPADGRAGAAAAEPGFGLIGMGERIERLGGSLRAGPVDGGWEVTASLPGRGRQEGGVDR